MTVAETEKRMYDRYQFQYDIEQGVARGIDRHEKSGNGEGVLVAIGSAIPYFLGSKFLGIPLSFDNFMKYAGLVLLAALTYIVLGLARLTFFTCVRLGLVPALIIASSWPIAAYVGWVKYGHTIDFGPDQVPSTFIPYMAGSIVVTTVLFLVSTVIAATRSYEEPEMGS